MSENKNCNADELLPKKKIKVSFFKRARIAFFEGLLTILPLALTSYVVYFIFIFLYKTFDVAIPYLPDPFRRITYIKAAVVLITMIFFIFSVSIIGIIARTFLGKALKNFLGYLINKLPVVNQIYNAFKKIFDLFFKASEHKYSKTVLVEWPGPERWSIGFLTGTFQSASLKKKNILYKVFIPTTPNPTTGFLVIVEENKIVDANITIEEAVSLILSGGLVTGKSDIKKDKENINISKAKAKPSQRESKNQ